MNSPAINDILNRLLILHERSLPIYLAYAPPWELENYPQVKAVIDQIVEDQKRTVDRLATIILENDGALDHGEYPMSFTSLHDLSVKYLLGQLIDRQTKLIGVIDKLAVQLTAAPYAQAAAREALGEAKGHLENLQELSCEPAGA